MTRLFLMLASSDYLAVWRVNSNIHNKQVTGDLYKDKANRSAKWSSWFALAASVLVMVSLGVIMVKQPGTEMDSKPEVVGNPNESKLNTIVAQQLVVNRQGSEPPLNTKLVASKKLNNELSLIKSDIDKAGQKNCVALALPLPVIDDMSLEALTCKLVELERSLHTLSVRKSKQKLAALLHPQFKEIGYSGKVFNYQQILTELAGEAAIKYRIRSTQFELTPLADDTCLISYLTAREHFDGQWSRYARRTSIWMMDNKDWALVFHQATPVSSDVWAL